jgi:hypothetical protein
MNCICAIIPWSRRSTVRVPGYAEGDLFTVQGSYIPFAATEAERVATGDPRRSLEARCDSHQAWVARVIAATEQLVTERLLLREDADGFIAAVYESQDGVAFCKPPARPGHRAGAPASAL